MRISTTGGAQAAWRRDGKELFFVSLDSRMMAVPLRVSADGKSLEPGEATALFPVRLPVGPLVPGGGRREYVVSADGQRFLVLTAVNDSALPPITLIQHWQPPKEP